MEILYGDSEERFEQSFEWKNQPLSDALAKNIYMHWMLSALPRRETIR